VNRNGTVSKNSDIKIRKDEDLLREKHFGFQLSKEQKFSIQMQVIKNNSN
jgi:hypothetical protein